VKPDSGEIEHIVGKLIDEIVKPVRLTTIDILDGKRPVLVRASQASRQLPPLRRLSVHECCQKRAFCDGAWSYH